MNDTQNLFWIDVNDKLPPPHEAGFSITVMISDGKNVSIGFYEYEYFAEDPSESLQYSSPVWHDDANLLTTDSSGWPDVTHWGYIPNLPMELKSSGNPLDDIPKMINIYMENSQKQIVGEVMIDKTQSPKSIEFCNQLAGAIWKTWGEELSKLDPDTPTRDIFNIEFNAYVNVGIAFFESWSKMGMTADQMHYVIQEVSKLIHNHLLEEEKK